jgi:hypothetical protein
MRYELPMSRLSAFLQPPTRSETPEQLVRFFAVIAAVLSISVFAPYGLGLHGSWPFLQDFGGQVVGHDFLNTWFFGKAAFLADPGRFYSHDLYTQWVAAVVPQNIYEHLWSYPPSFMLLAAPFGLLPYPFALAAWTVAGGLALYLAVRGHTLQTMAILGSTAALFCVIAGQISLFLAAITLVALRLLDRRPVLAGLLIALCTLKPQIGLLFPVLLIASRRWQTLIAATLGTLALVLASSLIWGFEVWRDYITIGLPTQFTETAETYMVLAPWSPTITTALVMTGLGGSTVTLIQLAFTLLAAGLVVLGCARRPMDAHRTALFLSCSIFATPYMLAHDLVAVSAAAIILAGAEPLDRTGRLAVKALVLLPMLQMATATIHLPGAALIPVGFALWAVQRGRALSPAPLQVAATAL